MGPDAALAACRFLHDAAAMLLWGASAYLAALVPKDLARDAGRRLRLFFLVACVVAVAGTLAALPLEGAVIGSGWSDAVDPSTLQAVLFETSVGQAWELQAAAALILLATLLILRARVGAMACASALLLAGLAQTGHAVMHSGWLGAAHRANATLHILSAGAWAGALVPLLLMLAMPDVPERRRDVSTALKRFSTVGHVVVALVIATGFLDTLFVLGRWPTDWSSPYQAMLALKIVLVAAMVGMALVNRYVFLREIAGDRAKALRSLRRGTAAEIVLVLCVIGLVSVFGAFDPA